jgi:hypothetical protein
MWRGKVVRASTVNYTRVRWTWGCFEKCPGACSGDLYFKFLVRLTTFRRSFTRHFISKSFSALWRWTKRPAPSDYSLARALSTLAKAVIAATIRTVKIMAGESRLSG